jgi:hypothetical protein
MAENTHPGYARRVRRASWLTLFAASCGSSGIEEPGDEVLDAGPDAPPEIRPPECPAAPEEAWGAFEALTGVLQTADDAQGLAQAFAGPRRRPPDSDCGDDKPTGIHECVCDGGGTVVVTQDKRDGFSFEATYEYRGCCLGPCCYDGCGWRSFYDEGPFGGCDAFSGTDSCAVGSPVDLATCGGAHIVEYDNGSFAVQGSYELGVGGEWVVYDAMREWSCVEDETGAGQCTSGADVLTW